MTTSTELAEAIASVPAHELAALSGMSTKTIYRLRVQANSPTLDTVEKLMGAVKKIKAKARNGKAPALAEKAGA